MRSGEETFLYYEVNTIRINLYILEAPSAFIIRKQKK